MVKNCGGWSGRFGLAAWAVSGVIPIGIVSLLAFSGNRAWAQVTSDGTLGTQVGTNGNNFDIKGGTTVGGTNLFHSFGSFSVPDGGVANFQNVDTITNIFGRVTGGSTSNIQGTIRALGKANLFLINPSGIIFGPNSRLDIGGSFVGTTANAIRFPNGGEFSMTSPVDPNNSVLAVNPSALFFNKTPAGAIVNQSTGDGLRVPDGRSLLLVGGDVRLDGGIIQAPGGRVDLGGLAAPGEVEIIGRNNLGLRFPDGIAKADISLTNQAEINASITSGGSDEAGIVILRGNNVSLDNSRILSQILAGGQGDPGGILIEAGSLSLTNNAGITSSSYASGNAGDIFIEVDGPVSIVNGSNVQSNLEYGATNSNAGEINITAGSLSLLSGSQVQTIVRGNEFGQQPAQGSAGKVEINVRDTITIDGSGLSAYDGKVYNSAIFSSVGRGSRGNAGNIQISTRSLSLSNSGLIDTSLGTASGGDGTVGTAGSIFIDATESVSLTSGAQISTIIHPGAQESRGSNSPFAGNIIGALLGRGGDVTGTILIRTGTLSLTDGALLNTSTYGNGNAGAVVVLARDDVSLKGGGIGSVVGQGATGDAGAILMSVGSLSIASTSEYSAGLTTEAVSGGAGNAGLVYVVADKDISIRGGYSGTESGIASRVAEGSTYTSGAIDLEARSLFLRGEGAKVTVNNQGSGLAGDIEVTMGEDIILRDQGVISAIADSGQGGNIYLTSGDFLILVSGSQISTESGASIGRGDGGRVFVDTRYIIAAPFNDNNISAEAFEGDGGDIDITANRLYDIAERINVLVSNDIDASSDFGLDGTVSISPVNPDPTQGLANLPANPIDPSTLISEACAPRGGITDRPINQFNVTGRGGLPPAPNAAFTGEAEVNDLGTPDRGEENNTNDPNSTNPNRSAPAATASPQEPEMVEAQGWVYAKNGDIIFTAQAPNITPNNPVLTPASTCNAVSKSPQ